MAENGLNPLYSLKNKTIWVAGHTGMVGGALCCRLQSEDCEILTAERNVLDLRRQSDVESWMKKNKPDAVIIASAQVGGILANQNYPADFLYDNLMIAANIIHSAYECGVEKLLFLGSSCIYPKDAWQPITEEALLSGPLEPTNAPYALAKIAGIKLCEAYRGQHGCDFVSAMPCNLYGADDMFDAEKSHVIPALIMKAHTAKMAGAKTMTVWGTGKPLREFLYVDDLADALVFLLQHYSDKTPINIGSGQEVSIADLAEMIAEVIGFTGKIVFDPSYPDGVSGKLMDSSRLETLGWQPRTLLKDGLKSTYQWFQSQKSFDQAA